jgi:hypothetical protein
MSSFGVVTRIKEQNDKTTCESLNDRPSLETTKCLW